MKISHLYCSIALATFLQGCDSSQSVAEDARPGESRPISSIQTDVFNNVVAAAKRAPQLAPAGVANLFSNPGFEAGADGWTNCASGPLSLSTDAYQGIQALDVMPNSCAYRSVEVEPGATYHLSCEVKLTSTRAWTGMGLVFANADYVSLLDAPVAQATSGQYTTLVTNGTAPAGTSFVTMWVHSDHGALVDSCSLMLEENQSVVPAADGNLLSNSNFAALDAKGDAQDWVSGCGGTAIADGTSLYLADGNCVDQTLTVGAIERVKNSAVTFACYVSEVDGYSDLSVFLDGKLAGVKRILPNQINTVVSLEVEASNASNGFVTLYSEGYLKVEDCALIAEEEDADTTNPAPTIPDDGSTPVVFAGTRLETEIRRILNLPDTSAPITRDDMLGLTILALGPYLPRRPVIEVDSLVGLEYATNLEVLDINVTSNELDIQPLTGLTKLRRLWTDSTVSDITPLANLTSLDYLRLPISPDVGSLAPLSRLTSLETIILFNGLISDLAPLSELTKLTKLVITTTPSFNDLSPLAGLTSLELIELSDSSSISDLRPLSGLTNLDQLWVKSNVLIDISPILALPIERLTLSANPLINICKASIVDAPNVTRFSSFYRTVYLDTGELCTLDESVLDLDTMPACMNSDPTSDELVEFESDQFCTGGNRI